MQTYDILSYINNIIYSRYIESELIQVAVSYFIFYACINGDNEQMVHVSGYFKHGKKNSNMP